MRVEIVTSDFYVIVPGSAVEQENESAMTISCRETGTFIPVKSKCWIDCPKFVTIEEVDEKNVSQILEIVRPLGPTGQTAERAREVYNLQLFFFLSLTPPKKLLFLPKLVCLLAGSLKKLTNFDKVVAREGCVTQDHDQDPGISLRNVYHSGREQGQ